LDRYLAATAAERGRLAWGVGLELEVESNGTNGDMPFTSSAFNTYFARPTLSAAYYGDHWLASAALGIGVGYERRPKRSPECRCPRRIRCSCSPPASGCRTASPIASPCSEPAISQYLDVGLALAVH
jgi:hypothetical protein